MFQMTINVAVMFSKFFSPADREAVLEAIPADAKKVLFVDTGATPVLADTIRVLFERGIEVVVRDHHRGEGRTPEAAEAIEKILGDNARIVSRDEAPACASLVEIAEFAEVGTVIVADPDPDGLTAAMKAAGVTYDGLDRDAAVLDGPRSEQTADRLSDLAVLLTKGMATLPPFNPKRPEGGEKAKSEHFGEFVAATQGDEQAVEALTKKVEVYEVQVSEAERLATRAEQILPGVWLVDCRTGGRFDLATLAKEIESRPGCICTVQIKGMGPIAAACGGIQYSLAVVKSHQAELDLRSLVPDGAESSPAAGLISNTSFLLHVSQERWIQEIEPALRARLG